ncbi:phosphopantetheine-binding protein [Streptomyces albulus]|nr:phosphopantetheine-binding protein [Streptomyces noursei]
MELGFDSLVAVSLRNQLGEVLGLRLPSSVVFDTETPVKLARWLQQELGAASAPGTTGPAAAGDPAGTAFRRHPGGPLPPRGARRQAGRGDADAEGRRQHPTDVRHARRTGRALRTGDARRRPGPAPARLRQRPPPAASTRRPSPPMKRRTKTRKRFTINAKPDDYKRNRG